MFSQTLIGGGQVDCSGGGGGNLETGGLGRVRLDVIYNNFGGQIRAVVKEGFQLILIPSSGQLPQLTVNQRRRSSRIRLAYWCPVHAGCGPFGAAGQSHIHGGAVLQSSAEYSHHGKRETDERLARECRGLQQHWHSVIEHSDRVIEHASWWWVDLRDGSNRTLIEKSERKANEHESSFGTYASGDLWVLAASGLLGAGEQREQWQ